MRTIGVVVVCLALASCGDGAPATAPATTVAPTTTTRAPTFAAGLTT